MRYTDAEKKPYPFCPGCSHGAVLDAVDRALEKIGADPTETVLVSDIGCIGMADRYFVTHTFHGLHGRSFTYACGIKMANPDLNVFVLVGDGGCGIGGHHLINAARRNIGIKVIVCNNLNFGMTGGEHSVTTPVDGKTNTTLKGNIERPFDLCGLVMAAGGTFVARKTAFEKDLDDTIAGAFRHEGFAMLDIWEICTAYYMPMNDYKKSDLEAYMGRMGYKTGILKEEVFQEYSRVLRKAWGEKKLPRPKGVEARFEPSMEGETYTVLLAGSAGMKVISAASNLCQAGLFSGLWASQKDDYPVTVQTGHSLSTVKLSRSRIHDLGTEELNAVIVVSEDGFKKVQKIFCGLAPDAVVIVDKKLPDFKTPAKVFRVDFSDKSFALDKRNYILAAISFLCRVAKVIKPESLLAVLEAIEKEKIKQSSIDAYNAAIRF